MILNAGTMVYSRGHAGDHAPVLRVDVLGFRRAVVRGLLLLLSRGRPRLIRKLAVGRIDNPAGHRASFPVAAARNRLHR